MLKSSGISFHVIPKDPKTKEKWIDAVHKDGWFPGLRTTICPQHFEESCFDFSKRRRYLLPYYALPTLKLDVQQTVQEPPMGVEATATFVPDTITSAIKGISSEHYLARRISYKT